MKKLLFGFIATIIGLSTLAQTGIFKKKRSYKVEGYIVFGTDTIRGTISIPITDDELDYNSLATSVTFIDSLDNTRKYTPLKASGFGLRGDAVFGEYVSVSSLEGLDKDLFLKKYLTERSFYLSISWIDLSLRNVPLYSNIPLRLVLPFQKK
jgi:hypothetical protein